MVTAPPLISYWSVVKDPQLPHFIYRASSYFPRQEDTLLKSEKDEILTCVPKECLCQCRSLVRAKSRVGYLLGDLPKSIKQPFWTFSESLQNTSLPEVLQRMLRPILASSEFFYNASNPENIKIFCQPLDCHTWELQFSIPTAVKSSAENTSEEIIFLLYIVDASECCGASMKTRFKNAFVKLIRTQHQRDVWHCAVTSFYHAFLFTFDEDNIDADPAVEYADVEETPLMLLSLLYSAFFLDGRLVDTSPPPPFPLQLPIGCPRNPQSEERISVNNLQSFSDASPYDLRERGTYWENFKLWHLRRQMVGKHWIDKVIGKRIDFVRPIFNTEKAREPLLPNMVASNHRTTRIQQHILFQACSFPRRECIRDAIRYRVETAKHVTVVRPLQIGIGCWAQVFEVQLTLPDDEKPFRAVAKIFDERLINLPRWEKEFRDGKRLDWVLNGWTECSKEAGKEAWAYQQLGLLQGGVVPEFYGSWEVQLPDGHLCQAHLLEYISGSVLHSSFLKKIPLKKFAYAMATTSAAINILGVKHSDLQEPKNVLITQKSKGFVYPVIIDFGISKPFELGKRGLHPRAYHEIFTLFRTVEEMTQIKFQIEDWFKGHQSPVECALSL